MRHAILVLGALALAIAVGSVVVAQRAAPPNAPAQVAVAGDRVTVRYNGALLFDGRIRNPEALRAAVPSVSRRGEAVDQVLALFASRGQIEITGTVTASAEAFPCESDRRVRALPVVRHSSGLSRSRLNQAVYDRRWDWVLSVDDHPRTAVVVTPVSDTRRRRGRFTLEARGSEILLRFRPRFYQQHRGLRYFEPWTFAAWAKPVVGWCSWFAFFDKVTDAGRPAHGRRDVGGPAALRLRVPADRRRLPARDRPAGALAEAEREVPGRDGGDGAPTSGRRG